jgi:hypothetical protein
VGMVASWRIGDVLSVLTGSRRRRAAAWSPTLTKRPHSSPFKLDSNYAGIAYKVIDTGAIDARICGRVIRFKDADSFLACVNGQDIELPLRHARC